MDRQFFIASAQAMERSMYCIARSYLRCEADCEDALQNALLRAWEKRRTLREEQCFKTWLTRILIRVCVDMQRRKKRVIVSDNLPEQIAPEPPDPLLREAIEQLEPTLRAAVVLYYLEGYDIRETASLLRVPQGTVKSRLSRARRQLQSFLKEDTAL